MFAVKAARAFTGRSHIAKLEGTYHGGYDWAEISEHADPNLSQAQPADCASATTKVRRVVSCAETIVLALNDLERTSAALAGTEGKLAAILIDVMPSQMRSHRHRTGLSGAAVGLLPPHTARC